MVAPFDSHLTFESSPTAAQIARCFRPSRVSEYKTGIEQTARGHPPALEDQLRFGAQNACADLQHPSAGRQSKADPPRLSKGGHELGVRQGMRSGDVDRSSQFFLLDDPADGGHEISVVNPGNELPPVTSRPAQAVPH